MNTKLLIVDDSALMRRQLTSVFNALPGYTCMHARNGKEAVELNLSVEPDVILLDINMPEMDGLTALSLMMTQRPVPVVMLSSLTEKGALVTFEALALGAVDYIAKPGGTISLSLSQIEEELIKKVATAKRANLPTKSSFTGTSKTDQSKEKTLRSEHRIALQKNPIHKSENSKTDRVNPIVKTEVVIIGVSTGGPKTLEAILPQLPADFPCPVVVAQHMPAKFTLSFAQRMQNMCDIKVSELARMTTLEPNNAYICRGGADVEIVKRDQQLIGIVKPEHPEFLWHPSVEILARSVLKNCQPSQVIGVMLTGMGNDGADGFCKLMKQGAKTIAESEKTAVVNGMPGELVKLGGASKVLPAHEISKQLVEWVYS